MAQELAPIEVQNDLEALAVVMKADEAVEASTLITVDNPDELEFAGQYLRDLVTARDKVKAAYERVKAPLNEALERLDAFFGVPIRKLNEVELELKDKILQYSTSFKLTATAGAEAARNIRLADAARLRSLAQDEEAMSLTAETSAEMERHAQLAEAYRTEAHAIEESTMAIAVAVPSAEGVSVRSNWRGEVTDLNALWEAAYKDPTLRTLFEVTSANANKYARLTKGARTVPGLRVYNKGSVAAKRMK